MKQILYSYAFVLLLLIALVSILSYGYGAGYVYVYFRHWQIQSNVWALLISLVILSLIGQVLWLLFKRYFSRLEQRKQKVFNFEHLHPYEKMAVLWLLDANQEKRDMVEGIFKQSNLLNEVIHAFFLWKQGDAKSALNMLEHSPAMAFELAELQRIEIYLSEQNPNHALTHLEFLSQHELSPWLKDIQQGYLQRLTLLWGQFAVQFPWLYVQSSQFGQLNDLDKTRWLQQILIAFDQASPEDLNHLQQRYEEFKETKLHDTTRENKVLWLKVLARLPEMSLAHEMLAETLLDELFDQEVFYLWFEKQLLKQTPAYEKIEQQLNMWEEKYPNIPIFSFARWFVYQETGRFSEAEKLLELYPDNILMSYLRIKNQLKDNEVLVQQLNLLFESNTNFLKVNL
ncbi:heme biosynthesis protein HemY [Acinetobacter sp. ANC 4636]